MPGRCASVGAPGRSLAVRAADSISVGPRFDSGGPIHYAFADSGRRSPPRSDAGRSETPLEARTRPESVGRELRPASSFGVTSEASSPQVGGKEGGRRCLQCESQEKGRSVPDTDALKTRHRGASDVGSESRGGLKRSAARPAPRAADPMPKHVGQARLRPPP